jgi:hypothetical protein
MLIGAFAGSACAIITKIAYLALPPFRTSFTALTNLRHLAYLLAWSVQLAIAASLLAAFLFLVLRIVGRSSIVATILLTLALTLMLVANGDAPSQIACDVVVATVMVSVFRRYGLLALAALLLCDNFGTLAPMTLDHSALYFGRSLFAMGLAAAIVAYAFWISVAAQPLFGVPLLEEE